MKYCDNCGNKLKDNPKFCQNCGASLNKSTVNNTKENSLGEKIYSYGRIKRIYIHKNGLRVKNIKKDYSFFWYELEKIVYYWTKTEHVYLAQEDNDFILVFHLNDGREVHEKWWRQENFGLFFTEGSLKKLLSFVASTGIELEYGGASFPIKLVKHLEKYIEERNRKNK